MKKLTKFLDLPLVQRFLGNRWAIGAACALMVATGVVAAMLTTGGTEPVSDAKSAVRDSAAEAAESEEQPEEQAGEEQDGQAGAQPGQERAAEPQSRPRESAKHGEQPPADSGEERLSHRAAGEGHRLATSFDNGTVFVGGAVAPGTYATKGSDGTPGGCRWSRLADNGGELVPIISGSTWGPTHITVHDGEFVRSTGCLTWQRGGSAGPHHGK